MKIIFLDIDGVLNSLQSVYFYNRFIEQAEWYKKYGPTENDNFSDYETDICPICASNLRELLETFKDIKIVISSTWRMGREIDWFNQWFTYLNINNENRVIGKTSRLNKQRGYEIQDWLDNNKDLDIENFIIFDDDSDMAHFLDTDNFIQTNGRVGFDYFKMRDAMQIFGKYNFKYEELELNKQYKIFSRLDSKSDLTVFKKDDGKIYYNDEERGDVDIHFYKDGEWFAKI